jgi:acyl-CoA hydrolase
MHHLYLTHAVHLVWGFASVDEAMSLVEALRHQVHQANPQSDLSEFVLSSPVEHGNDELVADTGSSKLWSYPH